MTAKKLRTPVEHDFLLPEMEAHIVSAQGGPKRLPFREDKDLSVAFADNVDRRQPLFAPGDDHEGRVVNF